MKVQQVAGKRVALWVLACSSICASAWQTPAPKPISGRPGVAASQGGVHVSDLAGRAAGHANKLHVQKVKAPEPDDLPQGLPGAAGINLDDRTSKPKVPGVWESGDPSGNWNLYKVAVDSTGLHFCDFATLGFNKTWIAVMCNVFANASNSNSFAGKIYVFDKFDLYNHGTGAHTVFDTGGDSNVTPAITYDNNVATEYLVEEYNGNQSGMGTMRLWAINGSAGSPALSTVAFPATSLTWAENGTNNFGPQLGNATGVDTGDARIGNVIYRNGSLWTTHPVFLPCCAPTNPPNRSAIQWWQIDTSGSVLQRGLIDTPDGSYFRSYPSIAVNQHNDAVIGNARYSPNEYVGGFYSFLARTGPPSVLPGEALLKTGEPPNLRTGGSSGLNRWGDYSNTSVDPADDTSFWTIQEYAASPSSTWGTWRVQVV